IDVQSLQDVEDRFDRDAPVGRPEQDLQVFLADFDAIEDTVEEKCVTGELFEEEAEIAAIEFHPESPALQVLEPFRPQEARPVILHPPANRFLTLITPRLLTFDPFVFLDFTLTVVEDAVALDLLDDTDAITFHGQTHRAPAVRIAIPTRCGTPWQRPLP